MLIHNDDVIKWKDFPRYWPFVREIHRSPVNSPHKGQWRRALIFSLICVWTNGWVNSREAGDLRRYRAHYDVIVMIWFVVSLHEHDQCPGTTYDNIRIVLRAWIHILGDRGQISANFIEPALTNDSSQSFSKPFLSGVAILHYRTKQLHGSNADLSIVPWGTNFSVK